MKENTELSSADSLRLNILLAQKPQAVRIDESRMVVYALTAKGEARVTLDPNCEESTYLRRVKEMLSSHVMDSPGGYPVFLERWTRMGQVRDSVLEQLLLLGESEAVVAVAHAPGLTETLARRVWWAMPNAANARQMLNNPQVAESPIGRELAAFLLEFLPFEQEAGSMLESVRLVLQAGLIDEEDRHKLWQRAQIKRSMLVGFLLSVPDALPLNAREHPALQAHERSLDPAIAADDAVLAVMRRVFSAPGQAFLQACDLALAKVIDQEVTVLLFEAIARYFHEARAIHGCFRDIEELEEAVNRLEWTHDPQIENYGRSIWFLSALAVDLLDPIFSRTDAIGSGMRRKIKPITDRIFDHLHRLTHVP
ncbi:MAG: sulfur reduction protein DsrS [Gammaproteobacteria bacterium]|nr:MAG: sulfur reduction protein DsrS [Gammaproteobacteria bacterium]UCH40375.1 MAG: sulfur reduction protein DsrS [Gammaproteobacteria bacterium]